MTNKVIKQPLSQTITGKIENFFSAIDSVENLEDGSIIINWKSNVAHNINGHLVTNTSQMQVQQAKEIHLNPATIDDINFENINEQISISKSDP